MANRGQVPPYMTSDPVGTAAYAQQSPGVTLHVITSDGGDSGDDKCVAHPVHSGELIARADRPSGPLRHWTKQGFPYVVSFYSVASLIFALLAFVEIVPGWDYINPRSFAIAYVVTMGILWLALVIAYGFYMSDSKCLSHRNSANLSAYFWTKTLGTVLSVIILWVFQSEFELESPVNADGTSPALFTQFTVVYFVVFVLNLIMTLAGINGFYTLRYPEEIVKYLNEHELKALHSTVQNMRQPKKACA